MHVPGWGLTLAQFRNSLQEQSGVSRSESRARREWQGPQLAELSPLPIGLTTLPVDIHTLVHTADRSVLGGAREKQVTVELILWKARSRCATLWNQLTRAQRGFYGGTLSSRGHAVITGVERRRSRCARSADTSGLPGVAPCGQSLYGPAAA